MGGQFNSSSLIGDGQADGSPDSKPVFYVGDVFKKMFSERPGVLLARMSLLFLRYISATY